MNYPSIEGRRRNIVRLQALCRDVDPEWLGLAQKQIEVARGDAPSNDLGTLLELCAHLRGPQNYANEIASLTSWLDTPPPKKKRKTNTKRVTFADDK